GLVKTKVGTQSSEHGVVATDEHDFSSSSFCVERAIRFLSGPDTMKQNCQFPCYGNDRSVLRLLTTSSCEMKTPASQSWSFPCGRRIWFAHSISKLRR